MRFLSLIIIVGLVAATFLGWGVLRIHHQSHLISTYEPARAVVLHSQAQRDGFGFYAPYITYRYQIGSRLYSSSQYAPLHLVGSRRWASSITSGYAMDREITVFVSPDNPTLAYLSPNASFTPYVAVIVSILAVFITLLAIRNAGVFSAKPPPPALPGQFQWYQLMPEHVPQLYAVAMILIPLLCFALVILPLMHYLIFAFSPYIPDPLAFPITLTFIASVITLIPAFMGFRLIKLAKYVKAVHAYTSLPAIHLSSPIAMRADLFFVHHVTIKRVDLALVCNRLTGTSKQLLYEDIHTIQHHTVVKPGQTFAGSIRVAIPSSKQRPTTPYSRIDYPRIEWQIQVRTVFKNDHTLIWQFPIDATRHAR
ncbi:DUF3592 domain-containing protein [Planctomycetota bacterium]|nr:DUF3592 domain-containing protein [Planctomycetota bacterium]